MDKLSATCPTSLRRIPLLMRTVTAMHRPSKVALALLTTAVCGLVLQSAEGAPLTDVRTTSARHAQHPRRNAADEAVRGRALARTAAMQLALRQSPRATDPARPT
jgi:hypothetical protein